MLATLAAASAADVPSQADGMGPDEEPASGNCDVTSPVAEGTSLLSRDGRHWVLVRKNESGAEVAEVWSTESGKLVGTQELPKGGSGPYSVRDCVAHRVIALDGQVTGCGISKSGGAREIGFPESRPAAVTRASRSVRTAVIWWWPIRT